MSEIHHASDFIALGLIRELELFASEVNCVLWIRNKEYDTQLYLSSNYHHFYGHSNITLYKDPFAWKNHLNVKDTEQFYNTVKINRTIIDPDHTVTFSINHVNGTEIWFQDRSVHLPLASSNSFIIVGCALPVKNKDEITNNQLTLSDKLDTVITKFCGLLTQTLQISPSEITVDDKQLLLLSKREKELLKLFLKGLTISAAAKEIHLSPRTIEDYLTSLKYKLDCDSKSELMMKAIENGWLYLNI